jgi:prevent-host-death family protein
MKSVGVRELKTHASEILRGVRERGETVELTFHGRAIALVVPVSPSPAGEEDLATLWADIDRLADEIAAHWPEGVSAEDAVNDVRREL